LCTGAELLDFGQDGVVCLRPPVAVDEEERQRDAYEDALQVIRDSQ
jgi:hypothetical protein